MPDLVWSKILPRSVTTSILTKLTPEVVEVVKPEIRNAIGTLFHISLLDVLTEGWKKYKLISKSLEESKRASKETTLKPLVTHTLKSVHHPYVELLMDKQPIGKLEFELTAAFKVEGLILKIQNGAITEIKSGTCQGSIYLEFVGESLAEVKTELIILHGSIVVKSSDIEKDMDRTQPTLRNKKHHQPVNRL